MFATGFEARTTRFLNKPLTIWTNWLNCRTFWLNSWELFYELTGCGFKSRCCKFVIFTLFGNVVSNQSYTVFVISQIVFNVSFSAVPYLQYLKGLKLQCNHTGNTYFVWRCHKTWIKIQLLHANFCWGKFVNKAVTNPKFTEPVSLLFRISRSVCLEIWNFTAVVTLIRGDVPSVQSIQQFSPLYCYTQDTFISAVSFWNLKYLLQLSS